MSTPPTDLPAKHIEHLSVEERIDLIDRLLTSLDRPDADLDREWAQAAEARLDAYLSGASTARDADEVLMKHTRP